MFKLLFLTDKKEIDLRAVFILIMTIVYGAAHATLNMIISESAEEVIIGNVPLYYIPYFLIMLGILLVTKRIALRKVATLVQERLEAYRIKISNRIRQAELMQFESLDRGDIYTKLTIDIQKISWAAQAGIRISGGLIIIIFVLCFIFFLSIYAGLILAFLLTAGSIIYFSQEAAIRKAIHAASSKETKLFDDFGHVLDGFKELKISHAKSRDLFHNFLKPLLTTVKKLRMRVGYEQVKLILYAFFVIFYLVLGSIVFILPLEIPVSVKFKVMALSAFLWNPIGLVTISIPELLQANVAAERLQYLERQLEGPDEPRESISRNQVQTFHDFKIIQIQDIRFDYTDRDGKSIFSVGPISLTLKPGEVLFLAGGNGSGKSTLLKMLTGLYPPQSGAITIDGTEIRLTEHRYLFSVVFADCHLFDGLYGIEHIDAKKVNELLRRTGIAHKVRWQADRLCHSGLSTGQTKRLALLIALMENKPIYVFDEWAAEQDPEFRKSFYETFLPELKARGKTIIAATHDDRYFHLADQVVKMEYGKISRI